MTSSNSDQYILHYWPGIPGRGEFIRLAFESVKQDYTEGKSPMNIIKGNKTTQSPSHFAPPILEIKSESGQSYFISQTPAILAYLAPILHLDGLKANSNNATMPPEIRRAQLNQITLTILDLNNETHDVHHPIAAGAYYEDQKMEAKKRADDFRKTRVPKFFANFQSTIETNSESKDWLIGSSFTVADLALFQVRLCSQENTYTNAYMLTLIATHYFHLQIVEGLEFAFPRLMKALKESSKYNLVFALRDKVAAIDTIQQYLQSDRRIPFR